MTMKTRLMMALSLSLVCAGVALADEAEPHPHKGVLKPYPSTYTPVPLSAGEQAKLKSGKPVFKKTEGKTGGRGVAVFLVNASPDVVWRTIGSFEKYPGWVDAVDKTKVYSRKGKNVDVYFEISSMGVGIEYYIRHVLQNDKRYMTWTLDYAHKSELDDSVGFWKVDEIEGKPNMSKVTYSVDIKVTGWVPGFIRKLLVEKGLKEATSWVKKQSEKAAK